MFVINMTITHRLANRGHKSCRKNLCHSAQGFSLGLYSLCVAGEVQGRVGPGSHSEVCVCVNMVARSQPLLSFLSNSSPSLGTGSLTGTCLAG